MAPKEAVAPLCSPGYAEAHAEKLNGPVSGWNGLAFFDLTVSEEVWTSWEDWFEAAGAGAPDNALRQLRLFAGDGCRRGSRPGWRARRRCRAGRSVRWHRSCRGSAGLRRFPVCAASRSASASARNRF